MRNISTNDEKQIYQVKANPNGGQYFRNGSAVVGCFNPSNGMTQIKEYSSNYIKLKNSYHRKLVLYF